MMQASIYDLMTCTPHEPAQARFTAAEFHVYRQGYDYALIIALKTMKATEQRFQLRLVTRREQQRAERATEHTGERR